MYLPPAFAETDVPKMHEIIRQSGLATLVTLMPDGLFGSHVPMMIDPEPAPYGTLFGHFSAANQHVKPGVAGVDTLAIFIGPDAYVSPNWYKTKDETGKVVPTWNYVAIHAYGTLELFTDPVRLRALVSKLTDHHETAEAKPWKVDDAPDAYIQSQLKGIVGFHLPIKKLEGKWKMSQNRTPADRAGVKAALTTLNPVVAGLIKP
jgi:transcriptional regulator